MKPIDFRDATWAAVQERLNAQRRAALAAWRAHGPGTTREIAARSGLNIFTLRPRTTELFQLGFVVLAEDLPAVAAPGMRCAREGIYRALTDAEALALFQRRRGEAGRAAQTELALR